MTTITLGHIAALLGCPVPPNAGTAVTGVAELANATSSELSFLSSEHYLPQFETTQAAAVVVSKKVRLAPSSRTPLLIVDDPETAVAHVLEMFAPPVPRPPLGIDVSARIDPSAQIGDGAAIGPFVTVGARCQIGRGVVLHAGVYVGDDVAIGQDCQLFPHVTLRERVILGNRVVIHANSVLGTDGFGYRWDGSRHAKVPQIGTVIIEDDVEIGSCVCIDRAKFSVTRIGRGTKVDNLVQIAHNVVTGPHCIVVAQAGLAGTVTLGTGVILGGQSAIRDHLTLGDGAMIAGCSAVAEDVPAKAVVSGMPAFPHRQSLREQAALRRLPDLIVQVRKLQEQIEQLQAK